MLGKTCRLLHVIAEQLKVRCGKETLSVEAECLCLPSGLRIQTVAQILEP